MSASRTSVAALTSGAESAADSDASGDEALEAVYRQAGVPSTIPAVSEPLSCMLRDAARDFPDRVALDFLGATTTYSQLETQVARAAEALRGVRLLVETDDDAPGGEDSEDSDESWYRHELVGLRALSVSGQELGEVTDVEPGVAQDRLVVTTPEGDDVAVPFVEALVPAIDPEAGTVTLAPPGGLFPGHGQAEEAR